MPHPNHVDRPVLALSAAQRRAQGPRSPLVTHPKASTIPGESSSPTPPRGPGVSALASERQHEEESPV